MREQRYRCIDFLGFVPFPAWESLPERIRGWRTIHGAPRNELAALLGVDESTVWRWEAEAAMPERTHRVRLESLLCHGQPAACAVAGSGFPRVERGQELGDLLGVSGTPTVLVNGWEVRAGSAEQLSELVAGALAGEGLFATREGEDPRRAWKTEGVPSAPRRRGGSVAGRPCLWLPLPPFRL